MSITYLALLDSLKKGSLFVEIVFSQRESSIRLVLRFTMNHLHLIPLTLTNS